MTFGAKRSANSAMNRSRLFASSGPLLAVAVRLVEEQRAELGVPGVVVGEEQRRRDGVDVERARRVDERADVIVVPGLGQADRGLDRGDADDACRRRRRPARTRSTRRRASRCPRTTRASARCATASRSRLAGSVVRPVPVRSDSASTAGRSSRAIGRTKNTRLARRQVSARLSAVSRRARPSRISSRLMTSDGAMRTTSGPATSTQEARLAGGLDDVHRLALPRRVELAADPHAFAAQVGEHAAARVDRLQAFHEQRVPRLHAVEHLGRVDDVEHGAGDGAGERIAAVRRAVHADRERARDLGGGQHRADRESRRPAPWRSSGCRARCPSACTRRACRCGPCRSGSRRGSAARRARCTAAAPPAGIPACPGIMPPSPCIGSRITAQMSSPPSSRTRASSAATSLYGMCVKPAGLGPKPRRVLRLAAGGHGEQRAAVERVQRRDHADLLRAVAVVRVAARELQRRLVRLGAGVAEEHALGERRVDEPLREPQRRLVGEPVRHVPELPRLLVERVHHRRMAVAERGDGDAAREVDVHPAVLVPDARAFAAHGDERRRRVARHHHLVEHRARDGQRRRALRRAPRPRAATSRRRRPWRTRRAGRCDGGAWPAHAGIGTAATTWISTWYSGAASFASTVARAGVCPGTTHFSQTAFIAAKSAMSGR